MAFKIFSKGQTIFPREAHEETDYALMSGKIKSAKVSSMIGKWVYSTYSIYVAQWQ